MKQHDEARRIANLVSLSRVTTLMGFMKGLTEIVVRNATIEDAEFLIRGNAQLALETETLSLDIDRLRSGVHAVFDDPRRGFYLIAEANGTRVGQMMITYEWSDWRNGMFWWIQSVYTAREFRRRGVFRALYAHVQALAQQEGTVCGLRLYVEGQNGQVQATYRRCGMHETAYRIFEVDNVLRRFAGEVFDNWQQRLAASNRCAQC